MRGAAWTLLVALLFTMHGAAEAQDTRCEQRALRSGALATLKILTEAARAEESAVRGDYDLNQGVHHRRDDRAVSKPADSLDIDRIQ